MATDQLQRPAFYEGQYLGATDLAAVIDYARLRTARHSLGGHTWGIAVGLALKEEPALAGGGAVDVFLQPGYAVDGFGRPIVVPAPVQIAAALFEDEFSGRVPVWLRYVEQTTGAPGYGFEVCETGDPHSRVVETYEVLVGDVAPSEQRDPVSVAGQAVEAIEALHALDEADSLLCDASIPFQEFPDPGEADWLIPLGYVRWEEGSPGRLVESEEDDRRATRAFRRYLGVVAEDVRAAEGVIRLRRRDTEPPPAGTSIYAACAQGAIRASGDVDLAYDEDAERVTPNELVWVEGNLRVAGDARLFGGKLEFRDATGEDHDVPLWLRRVETNAFNEPAGPSGRDLQVLLGESDEGNNRLVIGQVSVDADGNASVVDRVIVQDDGKVGIGTANPTSALTVPLTIRGAGDEEGVLGFEDGTGALAWHLNLRPGGEQGLNVTEAGGIETRLFLQAGGNIGIGTTTPEAKLDVLSVRTTSGGSPLGTDLWLRVGNGDDSGRFWVEYGSQGAPLLVLSDSDDPPRLQFQQTGGGSEDSPDFSSWIGHAQSESNDIALMNGRVGVGTLTPRATLHVGTGSDASLNDDAGYLVLGDVDGLNLVLDDNEIMARSNGALSALHLQADGGELRVHSNQSASQQVIVTTTGEVGLGTTGPLERLDVRGNIKLGSAGDYFAVGGVQNLRVIAGRISEAGGIVTGTGFTASRTGTGIYRITFTDAFSANPVVVATAVEATDDDNVPTLRSLSPGSVEVRMKSVGGENELQNTAFTFVALGLRA